MILAFLYSSIWLCNTIYEMINGIEYLLLIIETATLLGSVVRHYYMLSNLTVHSKIQVTSFVYNSNIIVDAKYNKY